MTADIKHPFLPQLMQLLGSQSQAVYVAISAEPYAVTNNCFPNVQLKIQRDGGSILHGWQVWQHPFYIEAEYHAVWQSPDRSLVDITPKHFNKISQILFLPEPAKVYKGKQVDNVRLNISSNLLVEDLIVLSKAIFAFQNAGERATQHVLRLSAEEAEYLQTLYILRDNVTLMLQARNNRSSRCYCSSGLAYEHCHGNGILEILSEDR